MIRVSTEVHGKHRDFDISTAALEDVEIFERDTDELGLYVHERDTGIDGNGGLWEQVERAILDLHDAQSQPDSRGKRTSVNLTLAIDENEDMHVHARFMEDEE